MKIGLDKEQKEAEIFNMVYRNDNFVEILHLDEPDFRVRFKGEKQFYGVEITELYLSESNARIKNIPGYATELLTQEKYRHKVDKEILKVKHALIKSQDGSERKAKVILQQSPNSDDHSAKIAGLIRLKNEKMKSYSRELRYVNLIIYDNERGLFGLTEQNIYENFFTKDMKTTLILAEFREVFLITKIEKNREVYVPLKMMLILSEMYLYEVVFEKCYPNVEISPKEFLIYFADYLYIKRFREVFYRENNEEFELIYSCYGFLVSQENGLILRDYDCCELPKDCYVYVECSKDKYINSNFIKTAEDFFNDNTFIIELAKDINNHLD